MFPINSVLNIKPLFLSYKLASLWDLELHKPGFSFASQVIVRLFQQGGLEGTGKLKEGKETFLLFFSCLCQHCTPISLTVFLVTAVCTSLPIFHAP